jgi:predicted O-linked N-acetylglucosamine transferase (SPINDLY family)
VTFGNFGGPSKLNLECLRLWATVLSRVPDSKLLLQNWGMNNAGNAAFVRGRLKSLGIDPSRVMILPGADRDTILKNYDLMDICLDSWPYCGGNTIAEALWQGVPVITLKGTRFVSAYGASLCIAAGLGDLVAEERADFADIAVRLAADRDRLIALRNTLRSDMVQHGISDPKRMARDLENAYFDMVHRAIV